MREYLRAGLVDSKRGADGGYMAIFQLGDRDAARTSYDPATYEHTSADIPMRDGLKLHVEIYAPKNQTEPLPFLFQRTPLLVSSRMMPASRSCSRIW